LGKSCNFKEHRYDDVTDENSPEAENLRCKYPTVSAFHSHNKVAIFYSEFHYISEMLQCNVEILTLFLEGKEGGQIFGAAVFNSHGTYPIHFGFHPVSINSLKSRHREAPPLLKIPKITTDCSLDGGIF
jgi:hypothetical protein